MVSRELDTRSFATAKKRVYLHSSMNERELRASIAAVGPLLPVLIWRDRVVDGEKRQRLCAELGFVPSYRVLHSVAEACTALWSLHPERALAEARNHVDGVRAIAEVCGARVADVAQLLAGKPVRQDSRSPRKSRSQKKVLVQVWVEPQLKHFIESAGRAENLDLSSAVRVASWEYVQRVNGRAPTEGGPRAPSAEWVKPRERRRVRRTHTPNAAGKF